MDAKQFLAEFGNIAGAPGGVQRLREMILHLAVSGKLIMQDFNEEPANVLLKKILEEKTRLIKVGKLRKQRTIGLAEKNVPFDLPKGWSWCALQEVCILENGDRSKNYPNKSHLVNAGIPFVNAGHLKNGRINTSAMTFITEERFNLLKAGKFFNRDILFCLRGSLGKSAIVENIARGAIASSLVIVRPLSGLNSYYVHSYLNSPLSFSFIRLYDNGTAQPNLSAADLGEFLIPIPPTEEQSRIVAKVDELMALCDKLEAQQQEKRKLQNHLRQATLQAVANAESPQALQEGWKRLEGNFSHLFEKSDDVGHLQQLIRKLALTGLLIQTDNDAKSFSFNQEHNQPWQIPTTWKWLKTSMLGESRLGKMLDKQKNSGEFRPYLRNKNVRWGAFDLSDILEMRVESEELDKVSIRRGDLVICEGGEPGRSAIWDDDKSFVIQKALHRFRCDQEIINPEFLLLNLQHDYFSGRLAEFYTGATIKHLTGKSLASYFVPVPPLEEQKKIIKRVDELMQFCDTLEEKLQSANKTAEHLATAAISTLTGIKIGK